MMEAVRKNYNGFEPLQSKRKMYNVSERFSISRNYDVAQNYPRHYESEMSDRNHEELDPKTMDFDTLVSFLHPSFILDYLQKVLQFVRSNQVEMSFQDIAPYKEEFLVRIAHDKMYLKCPEFSAASKSVASEICGALEARKNTFRWTYQYATGKNGRKILLYVKIFFGKVQKSMEPIKKSLPKDLYSSSSADSSEPNHRTKAQREFESKQKLIERLPEMFLKASLQEVLDFFEDKQRASLEFHDVTSWESMFLQSVTSFARTADYHQLFNHDCEILLKIIHRTYRKDLWRLKIDIGKMDKRTCTRGLVFHKVPVFENKNKPETQSITNWSSATKNLVSSRKIPISNGLSPRPSIDSSRVQNHHAIDIRSNSSSGSMNNMTVSVTTNVDDSRKVSVVGDNRYRSLSKDRRPKKVIAFQSEGSKTDGAEPMQTDQPEARVTGSVRKNKLIEAMSTPVDIDRGERMMRLMGWQGGALGVRGEGIIEPIIPALHIAPGAGLGHIKLTSRTEAEFRPQFLKQLLTFLKTNQSETTIQYTPPMSKREARFIKFAVLSFDRRRRVGLNKSEEVSLVNQIRYVLEDDSELSIECRVSIERSAVQLKKKKCAPKQLKRNKQKSNQNSQNDEIVIPQLRNMKAFLEVEKTCRTPKAAKALAYRILFLEKIKEFLTMEQSEFEFKFDSLLNTKQRSYIQSIIRCVNKKSDNVYSCRLENNLFKEIRRIAGDCYMRAEFSEQKMMLHKKFYEKRFTNSTSDLTSKDTQNTIIHNIPDKYVETSKNNDEINSRNYKISTNRSNIKESNHRSNEDLEFSHRSDEDLEFNHRSDEDLEFNLRSEEDLEFNHRSNEESECKTTKKKKVVLVVSDEEIVNADDLTDYNDDDTNDDDTNDDVNDDESMLLSLDDTETDDLSKEILDLENVMSNVNVLNDLDSVDPKTSDNFDTVDPKKDYLDKDVTNDSLVKNYNKNDSSDNNYFDDIHSSKRSRSDSENSENFFKKYKGEVVRNILIVPENYPQEKLTIALAQKVQNLISNEIDYAKFLPLLQCHGLKNNTLVYGCYNENTYLWLKRVISDARDLGLKVVDTDFSVAIDKLKLRINSFIPIDVKKLFSRIELYNAGLLTDRWRILDKQTFRDYTIITLGLDKRSYSYISECNFSLFAGVDKIQFSTCID